MLAYVESGIGDMMDFIGKSILGESQKEPIGCSNMKRNGINSTDSTLELPMNLI